LNKDLRALYTLNVNNQVIMFETNFSSFHKKLKEIIPELQSKWWLERRFNNGDLIEYKNYNIQRVYKK